jgi:hypothetical protein
MPPEGMADAVEDMKKLRPDADLRRITATYNCVGMVVASRRSWVTTEVLIKILVEDGFIQLSGPEAVAVGDVVVYHDDEGEVCHVGIVSEIKRVLIGAVGVKLRVLSKWGAFGEYFHDSDYVPDYLGQPQEYWTDRRENQI